MSWGKCAIALAVRRDRLQLSWYHRPVTYSQMFFITDNNSAYRFLFNTGAEVSVLPSTCTNRKHPQEGCNLIAANVYVTVHGKTAPGNDPHFKNFNQLLLVLGRLYFVELDSSI